MNDMTGPDELRETITWLEEHLSEGTRQQLREDWREGGKLSEGPFSECYAFADAWEAERAHAAADVCMWRDCEERNADLRKRLEAAEKACRMLAGTLSTFGRYSTMHPDEVLAEFAALAGEE